MHNFPAHTNSLPPHRSIQIQQLFSLNIYELYIWPR